GGTGNASLLGISAASGRVTISAASGNINDAGTASQDVTAAELVLKAASGIGTTTSAGLKTAVGSLQATNTAGGATIGLKVTNTGALTLADLTSLGWAVNNTNGGSGGGVNISTTLAMTVSALVEADRNVQLTSMNSNISGTGNISAGSTFSAILSAKSGTST